MKHLRQIFATVLLCGIATLSLAKTPHVPKKPAHHTAASAPAAHAGKTKQVKAKSPAAKHGKAQGKKAAHAVTKRKSHAASSEPKVSSKGPGLEAF